MEKIKEFNPKDLDLNQYLFFTGKGGVGKTTIACATAVHLADKGYKVTLVSTDPASNLQDVFETELTNKPRQIEGMPNLQVANFDPDTAVEEYKESVIGPYRGLLPESALENMEEQLSGSCTTEVASFNEFAFFLTDEDVREENDFVIFDTAPTGHTLRMLELPAAWTTFFDENTTGTSCMGQLSGLTEERDRYKKALDILADGDRTSLILVTRPERAAIAEADRASKELADLNIKEQLLVVNGVLTEPNDEISQHICDDQQREISRIPDSLQNFDIYYVPLRPYNLTGLDKLRILLDEDQAQIEISIDESIDLPRMERLIDDLEDRGIQIIFTMGKGGVGKTSVAISIAKELSKRGNNVRLATTDPADHINLYIDESYDIPVDHIDEERELEKYADEVLSKARETMDEENLDYIKEDLRSPCTQEIAVFRRFAEIVDQANEDEIVVIDTAPTGHTLLLLESSQAYAKEIERTSGQTDERIEKLLPRLQDHKQTDVVMVTLPENTPYNESVRLAEDLDRAGIQHKWWVINESFYSSGTKNPVLKARAANEIEWIKKIADYSDDHYVIIDWDPNFEKKFKGSATSVS